MTKRTKQKTFRKRTLKSSGSTCQQPFCEATLCNHACAIDACHIKPYSVCEEYEKNDPSNSISLLTSIHRLLDNGIISFDEHGKILISKQFPREDLIYFGLTGNERIKLRGERPKYLKYHRDNVFKE